MEEITAKSFFDEIKNKKEKMTHEKLKKYYENCLLLIKKFEITGQVESMKKLKYHITCMEKEMKLLDMGIDTYINLGDIQAYIKNVKDKEVLIVELSRYPREIPDEIVEVIAKTKDIFTNLYVLFTDYTGEVRKDLVEKKKKEKDPILFGAFVDERGMSLNTKLERLYYLGDWIDEYCDLTLEKLVQEGIKTNKISEKTLEEIREDINSYKATNEETRSLSGKEVTTMYSLSQDVTSLPNSESVKIYTEIEKPKKSFFSKIKTWWSK